MTAIPVLGYWKIRGLAAPIRLLLTYAGEEFLDKRYEVGEAPGYSREAWEGVKYKFADYLDFPNLPYFLDGDVKITQSNAILRHIARKHKLDGESVRDKAIIDMLLEQAMGLRNGIVGLCYNPDFEQLKGDYFKNLPPTLALFEKRLGDNSWFAGDTVTVVDFPLYELMDQLTRMKSDVLDAYPKLKAFLKRFRELPKVKEYLARDDIKNMPINNKYAKFW